MHHDFAITFKDLPVIYIQLQDTLTAKQYKELVKKNNAESNPIVKDFARCTDERLVELAGIVKNQLGLDWIKDSYTFETKLDLHKDIEQLLANGFDSIPAELDDLFHEMHLCLHSTGDGSRHKIIVEWHTSDRLPLDDNFVFAQTHKFGDVSLQNPYVGHPPLIVYSHNDYEDVAQTCKMHDQITPGIDINLNSGWGAEAININSIVDWFNLHSLGFVDSIGLDEFKHFCGHPVVGHVINLDDLKFIATQDNLIFEKLEIKD